MARRAAPPRPSPPPPLLLLLLGGLLLAAAQGPLEAALHLLPPSRVAEFDARCLDGSPPGYYIRRASPPSTSWKVHVGGGGGCTNAADCAGRAKSLTGSSSKWEPWLSALYFPGFGEGAAFSGLMAANDTGVNPFGAFNFVWLAYCDGSSLLSDVSAPVQVGNATIHLRGRAILDGVLAELEAGEAFLSTATEVLFSGTSAGGLSALLHASYVRSRLAAAGARLAAVPDAGWFMDHESMAPPRAHRWLDSLRLAVPFWNATLRGDAAQCAAANAGAPERCLCPNYLFPFSTVPHFIVQSFADPTNFDICFSPTCDLNVPGSCNATEAQQILGYSADLAASVQASAALFGDRDGYFLTGCAQHEESCRAEDWFGIEIDGQNANATTTTATNASVAADAMKAVRRCFWRRSSRRAC